MGFFWRGGGGGGGGSKYSYVFVNLGALKSSLRSKLHSFQCVGKLFCVEFQRIPLKFHTKYLAHTLKDTIFIHIKMFSDLQSRVRFSNAPGTKTLSFSFHFR